MEVIHFGRPNHKPPLLFIHGSYCGAWIWTRYFLPSFAQAGWWGAAISLRGHGKSEGMDRLDSFGIQDYLDDIDAGVKLFDQAPILIGHSMGGYLAQKYALEHQVRGLVLLAAPSLLGMQTSMQHIVAHRPVLAMELGRLMTLGPAHADLRVISKGLFNDPKSAQKMASFLTLLQRESSRLLMEGCWPDLRLCQYPTPTLALIGNKDAFVPEFEVRYEAFFWGGNSKVMDNASHGLMVDSCWADVAKEIMGWLAGNFAPIIGSTSSKT